MGISCPSQEAGKGCRELEVLGSGVRETLVPERSNLRFALADRRLDVGRGGEWSSLDLDGALLCRTSCYGPQSGTLSKNTWQVRGVCLIK